MMTPDTLRALIARVETATGPDLELDAEIALASGWRLKFVEGRGCWRHGDYSWTVESGGTPPAYTRSLDAALTLVPEGWGFELRRGHGTSGRATCFCWNGKAMAALCTTPALALCSAALRARLVKAASC